MDSRDMLNQYKETETVLGHYHVCVNLDKREFIWPHALGDGLKLAEQLGASCGVASALHILLAASVRDGRRGGGDYAHAVAGRWAGDRIAIIGDYATDSDLQGRYGLEDPPASTLYGLCVPIGYELESSVPAEQRFSDISPLVRHALERILGVQYRNPAHDSSGLGWLEATRR